MATKTSAPKRTSGHLFVITVTAIVGLVFAIQGVWAFFWPESFYDNVGNFVPYNVHYTHDVGAFQSGIGATLLLALVTKDALAATLAGGFIGAVMHAVSHVTDRDLGGGSAGPWLMAAIAAALLVALVVRLRHLSADS